MNDTILLVILAACVLGSGYFSATETAFSTCNRFRLKNMANKGNRRAQLVLKLLDNYDRLISTILVGNNFVNILGSTLATILFTKYFLDKGATISTIVMTVVILFFGEVTPKSLANQFADTFSMFSAPIIYTLEILLMPLTFIFDLWKKFIGLFIKSDENKGMTDEELITMVDEIEKEGAMEAEESELVRSAIEFNDLDVKDILTPRIDVVAIEQNEDLDKIKQVFLENQYSRLPVYEKTIDHIIGFIHEKDFYAFMDKGQSDILKIMQPPICVPVNFSMMDTLRLLQENQTHLAIVIDEYGGTEGIVTMEDILEELVGDIWDEHDEVVDEIIKVDDNTYIFTGNASLVDLFDTFDTYEEDEDDFDSSTVGGWVTELQERFPEKREILTYKDLRIIVLDANDRVVKKVKISRMIEENEEKKEQTA
ncbi:MAG: HlyC/CorC family transporter [Erysipelotrichaceae bacterium]|nr:HlyC/CorC family transporter [Erysipelotrichaceae bacterium]